MRARQDKPEPLGYIEAAQASRPTSLNRTPAIVDRARYQLEHGPFGRTEGDQGPLWATADILSRLVDMAAEDEREAVEQ